jgi:quinol monooxygenase YgiN
MILITLRVPVRGERIGEWEPIALKYARDVAAEPGCLFFEWSRSVTDPGTYIAVEGFVDGAAGEAHMRTSHVAAFMATAPDFVTARPQIIYIDSPETSGYVEMGEIAPREP